jgi:hypothetical protein
MSKKFLGALGLFLIVTSASADDGICKTMASIAKVSADQRDAGVERDALLRRFIQEGKLEKNDSAAPFVLNTVVWVYEEKIPAKTAYKQMYGKCAAALAKQR